MKWKIVTDTGSCLRTLNPLPENASFQTIPLIVMADDEEIVDTPDVNIKYMLDKTEKAGKSSTACSNPSVYAEAFRGADRVICVTITGQLSGSYQSARIAREKVLEENPQAKIYIHDSCSAGAEQDLLVQKVRDLIMDGNDFDQIIETLKTYHEKTDVIFLLKSIQNFVNNGRVPKVFGSAVGLFKIHLIGERTPEGTIQLAGKARGEKKGLSETLKQMEDKGFNGRVLDINHMDNESLAQKIADRVRETYPECQISIRAGSALCSYYAERGGIILGYEKE